ncbi:succinyl-diaminopimelate desuccinylase [Keratinibaculum paraultunense]|uniref:Succinyl-diaminopimelate desuccinylase n=1 Tax=Keratinibaculum paraultunense TaxID=1278232 RepID=A0A4R3KVX3_9FIRM|nr:dipeptidase PepV [Keratinibaculum paraultunense]QQY79226.1 dipeptidase PepV [Keratinibaculum paraultunense]TCS89355.1 succinyl-diaminopimelate desuccinylase [Keratinibaculum paraultunense]
MDFIKLIDSYKYDIIKSTQEIVTIKSVEDEPKEGMPFGEGPYKALEYALNLAKQMGFKTKNLDGYVGYAEFGEGEETLGILVHLDVVPEGDGWIYPPYGAEIHDGKIYGRGSIDDKGPAIACMYAMKALKESKVPLSKKIRIIFGTNEETDWGCMKYYFEHEKSPDIGFTPDANFPVIHGEKGIIKFDLVKDINTNCTNNITIKNIKGGSAVNMVPDYCEVTLETKDTKQVEDAFDKFVENCQYQMTLERKGFTFIIKAKGVSAHGSTPEKGKNAITYIMQFLGTIIDCECDICKFINMYNEKIAFKHHGEGIGCGFEDEVSGKLNFNPGVIRMEDDKIVLSINVRYPITFTAQQVYDGIRENLKGTGIELIEDDGEVKPLYIPKDHFLVQKLMKVYREETGDKESEPLVISCGTYANAMENAVAFGPVLPNQEELFHQPNEFISIKHLLFLTRIYGKAMYELSK